MFTLTVSNYTLR